MLDYISPDPVAMHARFRPDRIACMELAEARRWSYLDLDRDIRRAMTVFQGKGVERGDRVAALATNSVYLIIVQQALMRMGAIFVPLNWRLSPPELQALLQDCTPRLLLFNKELSQFIPECETLALSDFVGAMDLAAPTQTGPSHTGGETCVILYTSGTSGKPKGVMLTSSNLLATAINFGVLGEVDNRSVFLCDSPMFHVIGLVTQIWPPLLYGGCFIVSAGFDPELTNTRLADPELGFTHYFCVPQMAESLRYASNFDSSKWTSLSALFTGGAPNPPERIRWWLDQGVRMVDGYGMTETGTTLGMPLSPDVIREKAGSVGLPGPLTALRLVDISGVEVPYGTPGEILVSGLSVTPGYWNRPDARDEAFTRDGWLRTGDIAVKDEDGFISIVDRRKDMFISGGENVYPVEVEAALLQHEDIREAAVVAISDIRWGEVGCAFLVLAPGTDPTDLELTDHCQNLIARYKSPKKFIRLDKLPRTGSGKVMKHILRQTL